MNWANIEEIIYSECDHPQDLLGPHPCTGGTLVQAFFPGASEVAVKWVPSVPLAEETALTMEEADEEGYFAVIIPEKKVTHYTFAVTYEEVGKGKKINRKTVSVGDPYRHSQVLENKEIDDLLTGNSIKSYKYMGAHLMEHEGEKGCLFTVWAPNALRVSVVGEFNDWDGRAHQMKKLNGGIYELFIPGKFEGQKYQFEIKLKGDITFKKNDPYSFDIIDNASVITKEEKYNWKDSDFLFNKKQLDNPIVYELNNLSISAKEVKAKGYNCVLINPIVPESKITDYFYMLGGTKLSVKELKEIIDEYHSEGIYVIFNYSISGFGRDKKGMSQFDGSCLFEHMDSRQGLSADGKMALFQYARPEVISYLESNVFYMLKELHADGLSFSNVAQMMYLDY